MYVVVPRLMVAPEEKDASRVYNFIAYEKEYGLK